MSSRPAFLDYTPVELSFGTSGMRGLVKDLTDLEVYVSVTGALRYLLRIGDVALGSSVVLAGDLRPSTERIMRACVRAIVDCGGSVEHAGRIPTPALVLHAMGTGRAGVMVTGSHIPFDRNGIKINRSGGELLKSDEAGVLEEIARERAVQYAKTAETSAFDSAGMLKQPSELPAPNQDAEERYVRRYLRAFPADVLRGRRIGFWQHSAVGRDLLPQILRALGADVVPVGRSETFVPIDTENIGAAELTQLREFTRAHGPFDAIVSTDGDSDRPLMTAIVDGRVRFLPGDLLGLVVAEYLNADAVSVPVSANDAIERQLQSRDVALQKTKIGSPYVIVSMDEQRRAGRQRVVGWEANGGFLVGSDLTLPGGLLKALPTRDSLLPLIANFAAASAQKISLAASWDRLPPRFGRSGLIDNVPVAASQAIVAGLTSMPSDWVERFFAGFGKLARVDTTDGVRLCFDGGDVAHLRPSGNAPQLRIYAVADTQARADAIVAQGLAEPDGILRRLERAFSTSAR